MTAQYTGIYIAVPDDVAPKILNEGYRCSLRRRVPAHRNRDGALRAYTRNRNHRSRPPCLLEIIALPTGVATTPHKDGIKLETPHVPRNHLTRVDRAHSASLFTPDPTPTYSPLPRSFSIPSPYPQGVSATASGRQGRPGRLQQRDNVMFLHHVTSESNAQDIIRQGRFHAGTRGFIGPGIYFSRLKENAHRWCQCRTGYGRRVAIRVEVNLGTVMEAGRNHYGTGMELRNNNCDSYKESGRDVYMLPDDRDGQIDMSTARIVD